MKRVLVYSTMLLAMSLCANNFLDRDIIEYFNAQFLAGRLELPQEIIKPSDEEEFKGLYDSLIELRKKQPNDFESLFLFIKTKYAQALEKKINKYSSKKLAYLELDQINQIINAIGTYQAIQQSKDYDYFLKEAQNAVAMRPNQSCMLKELYVEAEYLKEIIKDAQERFDKNELLLKASASRFISLTGNLEKPNIFYLRSIQQMNGWLCGFILLYNAYMVSNSVKNVAFQHLNQNVLIQELLPLDYYNYNDFVNFYNQWSLTAYNKRKNKPLNEDPFTKLKTIVSSGDVKENFIDDQEMVNLANILKIKEFFTIGFPQGYKEMVMASGTSKEAKNVVGELTIRNVFNAVKTRLLQTHVPWELFCAVQLRSDHWILIVLINTSGRPENTYMIIMDSLNNTIAPDSAAYKAGTLLQSIFLA